MQKYIVLFFSLYSKRFQCRKSRVHAQRGIYSNYYLPTNWQIYINKVNHFFCRLKSLTFTHWWLNKIQPFAIFYPPPKYLDSVSLPSLPAPSFFPYQPLCLPPCLPPCLPLSFSICLPSVSPSLPPSLPLFLPASLSLIPTHWPYNFHNHCTSTLWINELAYHAYGYKPIKTRELQYTITSFW